MSVRLRDAGIPRAPLEKDTRAIPFVNVHGALEKGTSKRAFRPDQRSENEMDVPSQLGCSEILQGNCKFKILCCDSLTELGASSSFRP